MIDTTNVPDLFRFLVDVLRAEGRVLRSRRPEVHELLDQDSSRSGGRNDLELDFSLEELASTLRHLGAGAEFMWPGSTTESAGLRLLLTHLDEQRATTRALAHGPVRLTLHHDEAHLTRA